MNLETNANFLRFQDPLVNSYARIKTVTIRQNPGKSLILKIADTIQSVRTNPRAEAFLSRNFDPVLAGIENLLKAEGYFLQWGKIVIIGCSAGGNVALRTLFKNVMVPHLPIIIVMHHNPGFNFMTKFEMAGGVLQTVEQISQGMAINGGSLYFMPVDHDLEFNHQRNSFELVPLKNRTKFRPEIDRIMNSTARHFQDRTVGTIFSGMLSDGAIGLKEIADQGGETWIQEPASALFKEMPEAALRSVPDAKTASLTAIANRLNNLSKEHLTLIQN
jgi:chemotaxis response regulator CheB